MPMLRTRLAAMTGLLLIAQGCGSGMFTQSTVPGGMAAGFVTFKATAPADAFSDREPLTVTIWDSEQLAIAESTANCTASSSGDGQTQISCPPGVTYRKPTPETQTVTRAQLAQGLTIASKTVAVGERYRFSIGGKAADDCNSAGATAEGTARAAEVTLSDLQVAQTLMACVSPPPQTRR
jgi:hypothetical protein